MGVAEYSIDPEQCDGSGQKMSTGPRPAAPLHRLRLVFLKAKSASDAEHIWLVTLSDVLSLLLVFFIMFMVVMKSHSATAPVQNNRPPEVVPPVHEPFEPNDNSTDLILNDVTSEIRNLNLDQDVSVNASGQEIVISLKEKISFRPGESEILAETAPLLDRIADIINRYPAYSVEIEGHTDNIPIKTALYPSNWELSVARSTRVLQYFIGRHNIPPSRLSVKGSADQKPVVPNDTPEHRSQNRRVEIKLKKS